MNMEVTPEGISMISKQPESSAVLKYLQLVKSSPVVEVLLTDKRDFQEFQVAPSISSAFIHEEIQPNESVELLQCRLLSSCPLQIQILSFRTEAGSVFSSRSSDAPLPERQEYVPISALNPHNPDFIIKARIIKKHDVRTWHKSNMSSGRYFSVELIDKDGDEIRAAFFEKAVDLFFDLLHEGNIYVFSKGKVKFNQKFNNTGQRYELNFNEWSSIVEAVDDTSIKKVSFHLTRIDKLKDLPPKQHVDVAGLVIEANPIASVVSKNGESLQKRIVVITDRSRSSVELTLWNEEATMPELNAVRTHASPVLVVKNACVGEFNGVCLSTIRGVTSLYFDPPDIPAVKDLKEFAQESDIKSENLTPLTQKSQQRLYKMTPISSVQEETDCETPEIERFYDVLASIRFIVYEENKPVWYESCVHCMRKVQREGDFYKCNGCGKLSNDFNYRYLLTLRLQDSSSSFFVTAFHDSAIKILRKPVHELIPLLNSAPLEFEELLRTVSFSEYVFKVKAKRESTEVGLRSRFIVINVREVDSVKVSRSLLSEITGSLTN